MDTIRKNIVGLHTNGLIEMDTEFSENIGKRERYKKEDDDVAIWYEQKLDTRYALILIQKIMEMNNLSLNDKKNLVQAICDCAGSQIMESASYAQNVIKSNPLYDLTEKNGVKDSILFEGQRRYKAGNREIPDIWILLSNIYKVLEKEQKKKISFKLYKYNSKGQFEVIHDDREYVVSPYFVTERAGMYALYKNNGETSMITNEIFAVSNKPGEVTLKGFNYIKDKLPDDFEVCLIVGKDGHLSGGCWDTGVWSTDHGKIPGSFRQSRGGVLEFDSVLAWLPIEKTEIDIKELWWNPEYRLISIIYDSIMVFAKDADDYLTMEYYGGNEGKIIFYMDVQTGNILENDKNRKEEKQRYFAKNAVICIGELMIE